MNTLRLRMRRMIGVICIVFCMGACFAQFPGLTDTEETTASEETRKEVVQEKEADGLQGYYQKFLGESSMYRPVILTVLTLLILMPIRRFSTAKVEKQVSASAFSRENVDAFMKIWNRIWSFSIAVLVIMAMSGSLKLLGLTAGFLGMMLGWSLQQPVTGIAAWLMVIFKKPFRIGDRVVIAGITGDVTGITLTHVILNQVGGSVSGEERSGRGILIPNAILFQHIIINYTFDQEFMLDEVPVRLSFDADWDRAKELMLEAARTGSAEIIEKTGQEPFIRVEFLDWGVLARLRFQTIPSRRQEISTKIIETLLHSFRDEYPRVRFAIPSSLVHYRSADDHGFEFSMPLEKEVSSV